MVTGALNAADSYRSLEHVIELLLESRRFVGCRSSWVLDRGALDVDGGPVSYPDRLDDFVAWCWARIACSSK